MFVFRKFLYPAGSYTKYKPGIVIKAALIILLNRVLFYCDKFSAFMLAINLILINLLSCQISSQSFRIVVFKNSVS